MRTPVFAALLACASVTAIATAAAAQTTAPTALAQSADQATQSAVGEVVVTAQRRSESLQSVPIAVSAFTSQNLQDRRIDGAANLQLAVPNLNYSQGGYGAANFQIRGIGYSIVSTAGDSGVSIHENNAPLDRSRIADSEFYDIERIEVLRGPQGTLYGRNATGGVINEITAKPTNKFEAEITGELGNYNEHKLKGMINLPINDMLAVRLAGDWMQHDGYQTNVQNGHDIDSRDLYSTRLSVAFKPNDRFKANFMWEHFQEADSYDGNAKSICAQDPGPSSVGGVPVNSALARAFLTQGCLQTPLTASITQTGTPNSLALLAGQLDTLVGFTSGNVNLGATQPADPRQVRLNIDPHQHARNDNYQISLDWKLSHDLTVSSITQYEEDHLRGSAGGVPAAIPFNTTALTPGGVFNDPQIGPSAFMTTTTYSDLSNAQWSQELRMASAFSGPINFSVGGLYLHIHRYDNTFIPGNGITLYVKAASPTVYIDPNSPPTGIGHNVFNAIGPYQLESKAAFGELYWQATDTLKFTAGIRYTDDKKDSRYVPLAFLTPGQGQDPTLQFDQKAEFKEYTGRFNVDWTPHLSFTDQTLIYASYSRGYKGGGFNTPDLTSQSSTTYNPEFVNAFEIGAKNTLFERKLTLNVTGFYYDYENFQYSVDKGFSVGTANINAAIGGIEVESVWNPVRNLAINANLGWLHTEIKSGPNDQSIDPFDPTAGDPSQILLRSVANECIGNVSGVATLVSLINAGAVPASALIAACPTATAPNGAFATSLGLKTSFGIPKNITGNRLPLSPEWSLSAGVQYRFQHNDWDIIPRVDVHYQSDIYADIYNDAWNKAPGWANVNATLAINNPSLRLNVQFYVKNLFDEDAITQAAVDGASLGNLRGVSYLDPRTYGVSVTKRF